jgi:hypothetical protein
LIRLVEVSSMYNTSTSHQCRACEITRGRGPQ